MCVYSSLHNPLLNVVFEYRETLFKLSSPRAAYQSLVITIGGRPLFGAFKKLARGNSICPLPSVIRILNRKWKSVVLI